MKFIPILLLLTVSLHAEVPKVFMGLFEKDVPIKASIGIVVPPPEPEVMEMPPAPEPEPEPEPEPPPPILVVSAKWATPARKTIAAMTTRGEMWWLDPGDERLDGITIEAPDDLDAPRIVTGVQFLTLFTPAEVAALWTADPRLMAGAMQVLAQNSANLKSEDAKNLLWLAVRLGVLTQERADKVLAGDAP
jgi:hypothetical protein